MKDIIGVPVSATAALWAIFSGGNYYVCLAAVIVIGVFNYHHRVAG